MTCMESHLAAIQYDIHAFSNQTRNQTPAKLRLIPGECPLSWDNFENLLESGRCGSPSRQLCATEANGGFDDNAVRSCFNVTGFSLKCQIMLDCSAPPVHLYAFAVIQQTRYWLANPRHFKITLKIERALDSAQVRARASKKETLYHSVVPRSRRAQKVTRATGSICSKTSVRWIIAWPV